MNFKDIRLLALDPGETTGMALFDEGTVKLAQLPTKTPGSLFNYLEAYVDGSVGLIVYEQYRVYRSKLKAHINSDLLTSRLCGTIEAFADVKGIPLKGQMASMAKNAWPDARLMMVNSKLVMSNQRRHAGDAIRHGLTYLLRQEGYVVDKEFREWLKSLRTRNID